MAQHPIVTIEMENGDIMKAELYPEIAPNTVNNFISLIRKGFYDGIIFHRVIEGFMLQGGDPDGTGTGARITVSEANLHKTVLKITLRMTQAYYRWHARWLLILPVPSSLSCIKNLRIWTVLMQHLAK